MTLKKGFLRQAESDYLIFQELNRMRMPVCQQLHYLQMATEKLAKAFSCGLSDQPPRTTHSALGRFLRISKGRPELRRELGFEHNYRAFVSYIDGLIPFAEKIEALVPEGGRLDKPNPEYPWPSGRMVISPLDYPFDEIWRDAVNMNKLKMLIRNLLRVSLA